MLNIIKSPESTSWRLKRTVALSVIGVIASLAFAIASQMRAVPLLESAEYHSSLWAYILVFCMGMGMVLAAVSGAWLLSSSFELYVYLRQSRRQQLSDFATGSSVAE